MKNIYKKIMLLVAISILSLSFTACYDIIFARIMGEVKLEDSVINGHVNSIVRFAINGNESLVTQNGEVFYKSKDSQNHNHWASLMNGLDALKYKYYENKFTGTYISQLAADEKYLYAIGIYVEQADGYNSYSQAHLYVYSSSTWKKIGQLKEGSSIFCTNTVEPSTRKAYIRIGKTGDSESKVYKLSETFDINNPGSDITANGSGASTKTVVHFKGIEYFFDELAAVSTDNRIYVASGSTVYSTASWSPDRSTWQSKNYSDNVSSDIISLGITSDKIICGTIGRGLYVAEVDATGVQGDKVASGVENTSVAIAEYTTYRIDTILVVEPTQKEVDTPIYASVDFTGSGDSSSGNFKNVVLWSYYPSRGNWNRE